MNSIDIQFHELPYSKPAQQFVKSSLYKWLPFNPEDTSVRVEFFRTSVENMVGCFLEFRRGEKAWRHTEFGKGIHHTFQKCLKHLQTRPIS